MAGKETVIYIAHEEDLPYDPSRPEKELLRAVLQNALLDVNKPGEIGRKAKEYFLNPDEDYIFSFRSVCAFLNLNPRRILIAAGLKSPELSKSLALSTKPTESVRG